MDIVPRTGPSSDPETLNAQLELHKKNLNRLTAKFNSLAQKHGQTIHENLELAFSTLFEIVKFVNARDKRLKFWWEEKRSSPKIAWLSFRAEQRQQSLEIRTEVLKNDVSVVEEDIVDCIEKVENALTILENAKECLENFTFGPVGSVINQARLALESTVEADRHVEAALREETAKSDELDKKLDKCRKEDNRLHRKSVNAHQSAQTATMLSVLSGIGGAAVTSVAIVTAPAWAPAGVIGGIVFMGFSYFQHKEAASSQIRCEVSEDLRAELKTKVKVYKAQKKDQKAITEPLQAQHDYLVKVKADIMQCVDGGRKLAINARNFTQQMPVVRIRLGKINIQLRSIADDLSKCEYAQTRRAISKQLRDIVNELQECTDGRKLALKDADKNEMIAKLLEIEGMPEGPLSILSLKS